MTPQTQNSQEAARFEARECITNVLIDGGGLLPGQARALASEAVEMLGPLLAVSPAVTEGIEQRPAARCSERPRPHNQHNHPGGWCDGWWPEDTWDASLERR